MTLFIIIGLVHFLGTSCMMVVLLTQPAVRDVREGVADIFEPHLQSRAAAEALAFALLSTNWLAALVGFCVHRLGGPR